jgi:hypothetical protein
MVRSAAPVTNHSFPGSTAIERIQPSCPAMTFFSVHGACHVGTGTGAGVFRAIIALEDACAVVAREAALEKASALSASDEIPRIARAEEMDVATMSTTAEALPAPLPALEECDELFAKEASSSRKPPSDLLPLEEGARRNAADEDDAAADEDEENEDEEDGGIRESRASIESFKSRVCGTLSFVSNKGPPPATATLALAFTRLL